MYVHVTNGVVDAVGLPQSGYLRDGSFVGMYHLLPPETLKAEGWLPLVAEMPEHAESEMAQFIGYDITENTVTAQYEVVEKPEPIPAPPTTEERVEALEMALLEVILGG